MLVGRQKNEKCTTSNNRWSGCKRSNMAIFYYILMEVIKMKMNEYVNSLKNANLRKINIGKSFGLKRNYFLEIINHDITKQVKAFNEMLEYYEPYTNDMEKILDIWEKMETVQYINCGQHNEDNWKHNKHLFVINGQTFEYRTGTGIEIKNNSYSLYKLLFDAVYCLLDEANTLSYYSNIDDFLEDMGYTENIKQMRKGEKIYRQIQENKENVLKIWNIKDIKNIREIIEL